MPTERVVEVVAVCTNCDGKGFVEYTQAGRQDCRWCRALGQTTERGTLAPSSLAAAMLTLAEARLAMEAAMDDNLAASTYYEESPGSDAAMERLRAAKGRFAVAARAYLSALAAVRAHKDYRRPE